MSHLSLTFFGQFQASLDQQPIIAFESDKVRALLCYLAVEAPLGIAYSRSTLANLLWPNYADESARTSLRQTLYHLRKILGDTDPGVTDTSSFLLVTRQTIQFSPTARCTIDVHRFVDLLAACTMHAHKQLEQCSPCLQRLRQAISLYRGDFLGGFDVDDSAPFEEWRRIKQEQLHLQALNSLVHLANAAEAAGDYDQARQDLLRQLELEPWHEDAHRQLMRVLVQSGQRAAALAQYQTCRQILREELGVEPDATTTALVEQIREGKIRRQGEREVTASPLFVSPMPPVSLPIQLTPFVEREEELSTITSRLQEPDVRLLTLVGAGGMGKTRLAVEAARRMYDWDAGSLGALEEGRALERKPRTINRIFSDGIFFVPLAPLSSSADIAPTIAAALDINLPGGEPKQALLSFLRDKQTLLILDNFEHLLNGTNLVVEILQAAPQVKMIVTARERLNLRGEYAYVVQGMDYALNAGFADVATAPAVRLFLQSAQRVLPTFTLSEANLAAVLRICQVVQGMPLGLEMAAVWTELLSLEEIVQEIEKSIDFLAAEWHDAPARQRSLRAVFDWSWQMLNEVEQQAFRQLAVFRGGFTRKAAQTVAGAPLRVLTSLTHKSLLTVKALGARYEMHELLRQFAAEQLDAMPAERAAAEARHSEFYLAFVAEHERHLARNEPSVAASQLQGELNNIRQAWSWATLNGRLYEMERSTFSLWQFYKLAGLLSEGEHSFKLAAERLHAQLTEPMGDAADRQHKQRLLSKWLAIRAHLLVTQGQYDKAMTLAAQAIGLGEANNGLEGEALGHICWGQALFRKAQYTEARAHFEQVLQLTQPHQADKLSLELLYEVECVAHIWLCGIATAKDDYSLARDHITQSLALCRQLGKLTGEMTSLINLANIARQIGDYASARQDYERALQIAPQVGYRWGEGIIQLELGDVVRLQGEYTLACDLTERAVAVFHAIGASDPEALAMTWLGRLYLYLGDEVGASTLLDHCLRLDRAIKGVEAEADLLNMLALLALQKGDGEQANMYASQAWSVVQAFGTRSTQANCLVILGHTLLARRHWHEAADVYRQAIARYEELGKAAVAAEPRAALAYIAYRQDDRAQAHRYIEEILPLLATHPRFGLDEPFYTCLVCYQILAADGDPRAAGILQRGYALLQQYAAQIVQEARRRAFLERVPVHRELHQAYLSAGLGLLPVAASFDPCDQDPKGKHNM